MEKEQEHISAQHLMDASQSHTLKGLPKCQDDAKESQQVSRGGWVCLAASHASAWASCKRAKSAWLNKERLVSPKALRQVRALEGNIGSR